MSRQNTSFLSPAFYSPFLFIFHALVALQAHFSPPFLSITSPRLLSRSVFPLLSLPSSLHSFLGSLTIFQQSHPGSLKHHHLAWHHPGSISAQEEEPTAFASKQSLIPSFHIDGVLIGHKICRGGRGDGVQ